MAHRRFTLFLALLLVASLLVPAHVPLLFSPLLFSALLVGSAGTDTLPAAVFASVTAWLLTSALTRRGRWPQLKPEPAHAPVPAAAAGASAA